MDDGVAQQVLQRRGHPFQHVAIELRLDAEEADLGKPARFHSSLPDHALQARHLTRERHHQGPHQTLLNLGIDATLLLQQTARVLRDLIQRIMQRTEVADGFGQRARQLLHARIAIQFQRIELGAVAIVPGLRRSLYQAARGNLRLGFDIHLPKLLADAVDRGLHFRELAAGLDVALLKARAIDRHFAGGVEQAVQPLHGHACQFPTLLLPEPAVVLGPPEQLRVPDPHRRRPLVRQTSGHDGFRTGLGRRL